MLYNDRIEEMPKFEDNLSRTPILLDEVRAADNTMKKSKEAGEDGIVIEMIEATGECGIRKITGLSNRNYNTGYVPQAMRQSVFIAIYWVI